MDGVFVLHILSTVNTTPPTDVLIGILDDEELLREDVTRSLLDWTYGSQFYCTCVPLIALVGEVGR
jgi:hypothetical protein